MAGLMRGFYYSEGWDLFVATLFAIGLFFLSSTGHKRDHRPLPPRRGRHPAQAAVFSAVNKDAPDAVGTWWHPTFWFETSATLAFAVSWLTKGKSMVVMPLEAVAKPRS